MNHQANNTKLHRYDALLQAIDFFTQKFNINQLSSYAFEFTNEVLSLDSSALFIKADGSFHLIKEKNYNIAEYKIEDSPKLQRIATFYGNVMTSGFDSYFDSKDIVAFDIKLIIPLIIKDLLYGFIITKDGLDERMDQDDMLMSKALMQLINNALESSKNLIDLQHINCQLDQKIFNLFSINQSSRVLLSELDINKLYMLAIDIFSELTSSRITSFGLYDEIKDKIVLRGYRDVFSSNKYQRDFELLNNIYKGYKVVFNYHEDKEQLKELFKNYEDFEEMDAEYIILIVKDRVLGFVTISKPINDRAYDQALFELIESLAASTYISFKNAIYFNTIDRQRKISQQKLHTLTNLNGLIRNINSCATIDELCDITLKTLHYSFGIKKAFIAHKEQDSYWIKNHIGFELHNNILETNNKWQSINSYSYISYIADEARNYLSETLLANVENNNCLVISPISIGNHDIDEEQAPLGYIVVLHTPETLKEEEVLLIETMASSIAPVIKHLQEIAQIKKEYVVNQRELFIKNLCTKLANRDHYSIDFYIYYKIIIQKPFEKLDLTCYSQYEHFYFDNMLIILSYNQLEDNLFDGSLEAFDVEDAINKLKNAYIQNQ
ncbi:MAG: hypothetical protein A2Y23_07525 [Clostridiales bacterium GWB2_37_7]|nr:MAG: hypothetical protein A2Y23_07525 [Clostridiales bacterium GWB2_37_7]